MLYYHNIYRRCVGQLSFLIIYYAYVYCRPTSSLLFPLGSPSLPPFPSFRRRLHAHHLMSTTHHNASCVRTTIIISSHFFLGSTVTTVKRLPALSHTSCTRVETQFLLPRLDLYTFFFSYATAL